MTPVLSRNTRKRPIVLVMASIALMAFVAIYPPFLATTFETEYKTIRLLFEGFILFSLSVYLSKRDAEVFVILLVVGFLYMMNWGISTEKIENVLSHFNKFVFLLLIISALRRRNDLALLARNIWIVFWGYCSIAGMIGFVLMTTSVVNPTLIVGTEEGWGRYFYYNYPFIGNFTLRSTDLFYVPRYTGFLFESGMLSFFFGFNMVAAKHLVPDVKKCRLFFRANMIAGLLTVSFAFIIFLALFFILRTRMVARVVSNKAILIAGIIVLLIITISTISIPDNTYELLPYSSTDDRLWRYALSIEFLKAQSLGALVFGVGLFPFHEAIGGGASAGLIDVLASRGVILLGVWLYVLYMKSKHVPGLFAFILLYSLAFDYWHFPLFAIGLGIVASLEASEPRARTARSSPASIAFRGSARLGGV